VGKIIIKAAPDKDLYVEWSSIVEAPTAIGTRAEMHDYLARTQRNVGTDTAETRLARADANGSSSLRDPMSTYDGVLDGAWEDEGMIVKQRGWLPRAKLAEFAELYARDDESCYALLEPFEDDPDGAR
jgi:hypothetical protein